jgi:peptide/nickel transport system substrate-binding protein
VDVAPLSAASRRSFFFTETAMRKPALALIGILAISACRAEPGKSTGENGGTLVISTVADAQAIFPVLTTDATAGQVEAQLFDKLAEPGMALNTTGDAGFEPRLARSWTWAPDSLSIAFALDPRARWHDGAAVTARDVRFTWQLYADSVVGSPSRPLIAAIDSVTARDSLTAVFWFARRGPEQFFDATFQMRILPEHLLASIPRATLKSAPFGRHPVGTGPLRFVSWEGRQAITLEASPEYYRGRPHLDRVIWSIAPDPQAAILRLLSGEADYFEYLRGPDVAAVAARPELKLVPYPTLSYGYLLWNERDPKDPSKPSALFTDRALRRALTMGIDRVSLVKSVFDSLAIPGHGPINTHIATFDSTIALLPYAPDSAKRLLDGLGWRATGADGQRVRNGKSLGFSILVPSSSSQRQQLAVLIQEEMKRLGVKVEIELVDFPTMGRRFEAREFEAALVVTNLDPSPGNIRQSWSSAGAAPGGSNAGAYRSTVFDSYLDSATKTLDRARAKAYYRRAYETIIADAPAVWISEASILAGAAKRVHPVRLRADAWTVNLAEWYIPANERIARDNMGSAAPAPTAKP